MSNPISSLVRRVQRKLTRQQKAANHSLPMNYGNIAKLLYFERMINLIRDLDGDVVECGVGHGNSLFMMACLLKEEMKNRKLWGFDSFEGFPEPSKQDDSVRNPKKGEWGDTSIDLINDLIMKGKLDQAYVRSNISLVPGFFSESLSKFTGKGIAMLHIDADLYASYLDVLKALYPKVVPGGLVIMDEYLGIEYLKFPGPAQAIEAFFGPNMPEILRDAPTGKFYFFKPKSAA